MIGLKSWDILNYFWNKYFLGSPVWSKKKVTGRNIVYSYKEGKNHGLIDTFYQRQPFRGALFSTLNPGHGKNCAPSVSRAWCIGAFWWQSLLLRQGFVVSLPAVPLMGSCPTLYTYQKRFVLPWALPELPFFSHENMQDQTACRVISMETA